MAESQRVLAIGLRGASRSDELGPDARSSAPKGVLMIRRILAVAALAGLLVTPAVAQQTLKVGSTPTGTPFTFLDTKTNTIQGVMVDLITEIGKDAGLNVQIEPMQFSALIPSLTSSK